MTQRDESALLRGLPFQLSVEDIDHLLTSDADISRSSLWVPQNVRAADASSAHDNRTRHVEARSMQEVLGRHAVAGVGSENYTTSQSSPVAIEMGPPGDHGQLPPSASCYGAVHAGAVEGSLPPKYRRIEKVALSIGIICSMVFVVSLSGGDVTGSSSTSSTLAGRSQHKLTTKLGAACSSFLCPTSGHCVSSASKCPEGNPFLDAKSAYRDLIDCSETSHLCDRAAGSPPVTFHDSKVATALAAEGRIHGKFTPCDGFLCPMSGACLVSPANCSEGDPFAKHTSLYWTDGLAAKALLQHPDGVADSHRAQDATKAGGAARAVPGAKPLRSAKDLAAKSEGTHAGGALKAQGKAGAGGAAKAYSTLTAKQLEAQEVKSEAASLEKADAAIAESIFAHAKPVSTAAAARAGEKSSAEKLLKEKAPAGAAGRR